MPQQQGAAADQFAVTVEHERASCPCIVVSGDVDARAVDTLTTVLARYPAVETTALVADLSAVTFCSINGLHMILDLFDRSNAVAVPLELVVDAPLRRLLGRLECAAGLSTHLDRAAAMVAIDAPEAEALRA
ncbi:hypothetical protein CFN78_25955 [Amycolatopsis antarctica]|uniref:STAS domain-containing protein n=1 Tax=Amycolatopsis antarctica TaxID=1854586 RepID=A0A263CYG1_9PSEU|nr:hypothetical protein CFN78_25955 [Amycolatopsis antarctica]